MYLTYFNILNANILNYLCKKMGKEFWGFLYFVGCDFSIFGGCSGFSKLASNITLWSSLVAIRLLMSNFFLCVFVSRRVYQGLMVGIMEVLEQEKGRIYGGFPHLSECWQ